jgi:hypothetical protein
MRRLSRRSRAMAVRVGLALAGAAAVAAPALLVAQAGSPSAPVDDALVASAAWRDWVDGQRSPQVPPSAGTESAIVLLDGPGIVDVPRAERQAAVQRMQAQQLAVEATLQGMGGLVTHRYRTLINGIAVRVPAGRLATLAEVAGIQAVVPVLYMSPAANDSTAVTPTGPGPDGAPAAAAGRAPVHLALIDTAVDATHPWLGGGIGPTRLIIGATDLVEGDADPAPDPADPGSEAHGTQMASIILRSPALADLPPQVKPRMILYRVTARESVDGRVRSLARTDRVLAALEMAVDPNRDGLPGDRAEVIIMGLARGFGGAGTDPVARALSAANRAGSVVVVPAGNDGPTGTAPGTVGTATAAPGVLSVGGLAGARGPRTADLQALVGPASARMGPLPLMGAEPGDAARTGAPLVAATGDVGVGTGTDARDFAGVDGRSTVAGAIAMVVRSGAPIAEVARRAAGAGAVGLAVWDEGGTGAFPGIQGGADVPIPVVGLGPQQGRALRDLLGTQPDARITITPRSDAAAAPLAIAAFSSRGPSAAGRVAPLVVAPAVGVEAAYPGSDASGSARQAPLTGTSAAAASVAAVAARLRVDHPDWTPADVRSVIAQSAGQVPGATPADQGVGAAPDPASIAGRALPGVSVDPPVISAPRSRADRTTIAFTLRDLTGTGGRYRLLLQDEAGEYRPLGAVIRLAPGARHRGVVTIPRARRAGAHPYRARLLVVPVGGQVAAGSALVWSAPAPAVPPSALGVPQVVRTGTGLGQVVVRVGMRHMGDKGLTQAVLHDVRVDLSPVGGGELIRMTQGEPSGDWPAATYRLLLSRRSARGPEVPAGRYRAVVSATASDGRTLRTRSAPFAVGG